MARESGLSALNNAAGFIKKNKFGRETDLIYLDSGTEQEMVEEVDTQAEEYIKDIVTKNLSEVALGDKALTRLRDALSEIIEAESAGSKDKKETAEFLVQTIRDAAKNMPTDRDGLAKKIRAEILTKELEKKIEDELSSETE
jgi:hypothetical protein